MALGKRGAVVPLSGARGAAGRQGSKCKRVAVKGRLPERQTENWSQRMMALWVSGILSTMRSLRAMVSLPWPEAAAHSGL
jgi:hypothetical protein